MGDKPPRKGSIRDAVQRVGRVVGPVMVLAEIATDAGITHKQVAGLLKAAMSRLEREAKEEERRG